ncbi:MAG TPA: LysR family transcriptional regulator [Xanthobacteraceae bacterium]|jgi:DNA-binding transcriptional LysR family regulator|nr:LysR family transcriptional regulator [Xanthobacteraceae bacterium]
MLDFRSLETFLWVAKLRSFRGAAERLNTTQPAISMRIAQLEDDLGVKLLERDRRAVSLTEKGQLLLRHAEHLLRQRASLIEAVGDNSVMSGVVRLGASETIVHTWLPKLIERVNAEHPNLEIEIEVDISPNLRDRLRSKDLDLALLLGPVGDYDLESKPLCSYPIGFVAGSKIRFRKNTVPVEEIAAHPLITFSRNTQPYIALRRLCEQMGLHAKIHASASLATVVRMALDGIGIAVMPPAIIKTISAPGRLREIKCSAKMPPFDYFVSWPVTADGFAVRKVAALALEVAKRERPTRGI